MDYSKFTSEWKDATLQELLVASTPYRLCHLSISDGSFDPDLLNTFFKQLQERGFLDSFSINLPDISVAFTSSAIDFVARGGFAFEEQAFEVEMQKAILELEKLQSDPSLKDHVDQISRVTSIITNAVTAFNTFVGRGLQLTD